MGKHKRSKTDLTTKAGEALPPAAPTLAQPDAWLLGLFGVLETAAGKPVTPETAMRVPAVACAVRTIAEAVGQLPFHAYRTTAAGGRERDPNHPAYALVHDDATDWTSAAQFRQQLTTDALLHGDGLAFVGRNGAGDPVELYRLKPGSFEIRESEVDGGPVYVSREARGERVLPRADVLHIPAFSINGLRGLSPIVMARESIAVLQVLAEHAGKLFGRGARPSGTLNVPEGARMDAETRLETTVGSAATRAQSALKGLASSFASGFLGGFAAGGVQGFVSEIRSATRAMSDLKAEAAKAGVGVEAFQALGYAARQNNVSLDALTDGLKELQLRADEFIVTGKGSGAEAFARLGYGADELKAKLRDPAALFTEIIGRIKALGNTAAAIRIADEIFGGTGGEQFVRFLEQGEAGIRRNMDEARRLGLVLEKDVIEKGAELDRQFQKIADTIGNNIKSAVVSVATSLASWGTNVEGFLAALGNSKFFAMLNKIMGSELEAGYYGAKLIDRSGAETPAGALDPKAVNALREAMVAAGTTARANVPNRAEFLPERFVDPKLAGLQTDFRGSLAKLIDAAKDAGHDIKITSGFRSVERQQELWAAAVKKYGSEDAARKWVAPPGRSFHNKGTAADLGYGSDAARTWAHANANRFGVTFPLGNEPWHIEPEGQRGSPKDGDPDTSGLERQSTARAKVTTEADKQAAAVARVMQALALETAQVGETEARQRVLQEVQAAGVDIASREGQAIAAKVTELYRLKAAQEAAATSAENLKRAREDFANLGASAAKGFVADLKAGASAADALRNALDRIIQRLLDSAIDNLFASLLGTGGGGGLMGGGAGGLLGSLFSGLFGGARAKGGPVERGKSYVVGEKRAEVFTPQQSGRILPRVPSLPTAAMGKGAPLMKQQNTTRVRHESRISIDLEGANGDETIRRIAGEAAAAGSKAAFKASMKNTPARMHKQQVHGW